MRRIAKVKLRMKLRTFFISTSVLLAVFGIFSAFVLVQLTTEMKNAAVYIYKASESIRVADDLSVNLLTHNRESFLEGIEKAADHRHKRRMAEVELERGLTKSEEFIGSEEERTILEEVKADVGAYLARRQALMDEGVSPLAAYQQSYQILAKAQNSLNRFIDVNRAQAKEMQAYLAQQDKDANKFGLAAAILVLVTIGWQIFASRKFIYNPLYELRRAISDFRSNRFNGKAPERGVKEIVEISSTFNEMAATLAQQRDSQVKFLASVAHDLRNPLGAITMSAEMLSSEDRISKKDLVETLGIIKRQSRHLDGLVNDLLDLTRIEAGNLNLNKSRADIRTLAQEAVLLHRSSTKSHNLRISVPATPVRCECDPMRINQVLNNLITNSIKYSPFGGDIDVEVTSEEDEAILRVRDRGMGIQADELEKIFEPFRRSPATKNTIPGVGIGLAATRKIVEAHGGKISVDSVLGQGSTFTVRLPAKSSSVVVSQVESRETGVHLN